MNQSNCLVAKKLGEMNVNADVFMTGLHVPQFFKLAFTVGDAPALVVLFFAFAVTFLIFPSAG